MLSLIVKIESNAMERIIICSRDFRIFKGLKRKESTRNSNIENFSTSDFIILPAHQPIQILFSFTDYEI